MKTHPPNMKKLILRLTLATTGIACLPSTSTESGMKNIERFLEAQVSAGKTPSVQYAFFDLDSTIYSFRRGVRNVASGEAAGEQTTYQLFSITKTFTALAVLQLAEEGKIGLDEPVRRYLPDFRFYSDSITVKQLLQHSAGLPNPVPLRWIHTEAEHDSFDRDRFFDGVFSAHPNQEAEPGTRFKYSNPGYVILGRLIERVSGQSYEDYVHTHIIAPSGSDSAELGFRLNPSVHATGYQKWFSFTNLMLGLLIDKKKFMGEKEKNWKPFRNFYINGTPYGGMNGTVIGLRRYAQALMKKNSVLLGDQYKELLLTEAVIGGKATGMSMSWFTGTLKGHRYFAHAGGGGGYYVELRIYPDLGVGSVILFNRSGMKDERFLDQTDTYFITAKAAK